MARMSWADMKSEAIRELRSRDDISTRAEFWLKQAAMEVAYSFRFHELEASATFSLGVNQSEVVLSAAGVTNLKHVFSVRDQTSGRRVNVTSFRQIDRMTISNGTPAQYCRFGGSILFDAKPSTTAFAYKIRYRKQIIDPIYTGSASPETPEEWDEIIRLKAVSRGFYALFEPNLGLDAENRAMRMVALLPTDEFVEAEDQDFGLTPRNQWNETNKII